MSDDDRFNRIEHKLDGITQILATQAAHDERLTALSFREQRSEERLDTIEVQVQNNSFINKIVSWVSATTVAALIVYVISQITGKGS